MSRWGLIDNTLEGRQKLYFPHFCNGRVPTDPEGNRNWRRSAFLAQGDDRKVLRKLCAEDFLFYCAGFLSLFDAGDESGTPGTVPFIPYDYQVELFTAMWYCLHDARQSLRCKKPRKLGLSWMVMALFEHCWHFMRDRHMLVGSHREEELDSPGGVSASGRMVGDWSKLLCKVDFLHLTQPPWLLPTNYEARGWPNRRRLKMTNPDTGSLIWGTSASSRAAHGQRGYAAVWDEASRTETLYDIIGGLTEFAPCKFWISTIGNLDHPFSTVLRDAPGIFQLSPEWWMHPIYSQQVQVDAETGKRTSPWLAKKLSDINNDELLANQQYFADEDKQQGNFYHSSTFHRMLTGDAEEPPTVMEPFAVGELDVVDTPEGSRVTRFCEQRNGRWKFWMRFDASGRPSRATRYIMGCDIAAGTMDNAGRGASNSVLALCDWMTGELVAEFVTHGVKPYELARLAGAAGWWFEGDDFLPARINYERNGPGGEFGDELLRKLLYPNMHRDDTSVTLKDVKYGWHKGTPKGTILTARSYFALHQQMICEGLFKERSLECAKEMRHYQNVKSGGAPVHSASLMSADPSGARENHGDRVITRICICQVLNKPYKSLPKANEAPWGSYRYLKEAKQKADWEAQLV